MDEYKKKDKFNRQQINKEIMGYVINNGELIKNINCFGIYKLK